MITLICGPMYSGKSTVLFQRMERLLYAKKHILLIRPKIDNRPYYSHNNSLDTSILKSKFNDLFTEIQYIEITDEISNILLSSNYDAIFIDEYFMIKGCHKLALQPNIDIYYGGLLASSNCELFEETKIILPYCDFIQKLNSVCMECGNEIANYSYANFNKTSIIDVGDTKYKCVCHKCYNRLSNNQTSEK